MGGGHGEGGGTQGTSLLGAACCKPAACKCVRKCAEAWVHVRLLVRVSVESVPSVPSVPSVLYVTCLVHVPQFVSEFAFAPVGVSSQCHLSASRPINMSLPRHTAVPSSIDCPAAPRGSHRLAALMATPNRAVLTDCIMTSSHT